MKLHEQKDLKTKELAKKYPSYREYKANGTKEGGWGMTSIERRYGSWNAYKQSIGEEIKVANSEAKEYTVEELIEEVKKYKLLDKMREAKANGIATPSEKQIIRSFGSWRNARVAAGLPCIATTFDREVETLVYLVWFVEDDVFKVGVTQKSLQERGKRWPEYYVVDCISTSAAAALSLEKKVLEKFYNTKFYYDKIEGNGATECFKYNDIPSLVSLD